MEIVKKKKTNRLKCLRSHIKGYSLSKSIKIHEFMITHTHTHTKAQICTREARQMLPEPRLLSPRPTRCHLRSMFGPAPPPATPLPGPLATAPCPAPLRQLLTSSSGVRVSRSPQQQHHLQQQHRDPLHPAIFLLYCHPGPLWQPPPAQDPRLT